MDAQEIFKEREKRGRGGEGRGKELKRRAQNAKAFQKNSSSDNSSGELCFSIISAEGRVIPREKIVRPNINFSKSSEGFLPGFFFSHLKSFSPY